MKKTMILMACMLVAGMVQAGSVKQDGIILKVKSKSEGKNNGSYNTAPHGRKFVFVEVEVLNKRSESVYVNPVKFQLIDSDGYAYDWTPSHKKGLQSVTLENGQKAAGRIAFEVPYNASPRTLVFKVGYKEKISIRL